MPWYAFFEGHPFRVRYMVPLVAGAAVGIGLLIGSFPRHVRGVLAAVVLLLIVVTSPAVHQRPHRWCSKRSGTFRTATNGAP